MKSRLLITYFLLFSSLLTAQTKEEKLNEILTVYSIINKFNGSALVYHKGKILLNQGYGYKNLETGEKNYSNTIFQIGSVTKQFTVAIILKLQEQGKLSIQDKLSKYFPEYPKGDSITIHHLLSHTSGIYNYTNNEAFMQNELTKPASREKMMALFANKPLDFPPGSQMQYSNSNFLLLGYIIEKVANRPYEEMVHEFIFRPLQMNESGFDFAHLKNRATGYTSMINNSGSPSIIVDSTVSFAGGAMYSTTADLLKWHLGLLNNRVIKRSSIEKAFTAYKNDFGYGWVIDSFDTKKAVYHNGSILGFTSNIYRIEQDNTCIIILNNIPNPKIDIITKDLLAALYDKPYKLPEQKKEISLGRGSLNKYLGSYEFNPDFKMNILYLEKGIYAQKIGEENKFEIFPYKEHHFFLKAFEAELEFKENNKNKIDTLILRQGDKAMFAKKIVSNADNLYDTISGLDSIYTDAYNTKNIEKLKTLFSTELKFFQDSTGYADYAQHIKIFEEKFSRKKKMRRELLKESLEVYPVKNFGAIEIGIHNFYVREEGQTEKLDSRLNFVHVWQYKDGKWKIVQIISYSL
jgi:CubicO group peptidase (beta-lactamase class C family)